MKTLPQSTQNNLLEAMLDGSRVATLVTDPDQPDNPIIFANGTFEKMTGYSMDETLGRNCRFLQGPDTDPAAIEKIRKALETKTPITVVLKNYKKDGSLFWNRLTVEPYETDGKQFFIGTQTDVSVEYAQRKELEGKEDEIEALMLPIMMIRDDLAAVSLIGEMSPQRFTLLTQKLSGFVQKTDVDHVIIDITGLYWNHESPLSSLLAVQDVLKLMGSHLYITGISPKMAQALARARSTDEPLHTFASIRQAIERIR